MAVPAHVLATRGARAEHGATVRTAAVGVAGTALLGLGGLVGVPLITLVCAVLVVLVAVLLFLRQIIFAADDEPAARLERLLRAVRGRPDSGRDVGRSAGPDPPA